MAETYSIEGLDTYSIEELNSGTPIWRVHITGRPYEDLIMVGPDKEKAVCLFIKQGDAEHFARLLKPGDFKDVSLEVIANTKEDVLGAFGEENVKHIVIPPNSAKEFFEKFPEIIGKYYDTEK